MKQTLKLSWVLIALLAVSVITSCKKDDNNNVTEATAGFDYQIDASNSMLVHFTNKSVNATSYTWDFGDGQTSTSESPDHEYTSEGTFTVKLTAANSGSSDFVTQQVTIVNADAMLQALTGGTEKTWILVRQTVDGKVYPLQVGPADYSEIWWAFGRGNDLAQRTCLLDDQWTFKADGSMIFDDAGTYWAEGGVYHDTLANKCQPSGDASMMYGPNNEDLSAWGSSDTHTWAIDQGKLTVSGLGAYIGLSKAATDSEVKVPQQSVTYNIITLNDGNVDTLIVQTAYNTGDTPPKPAYWRFVLVHYDNPGDQPPIPGPKPTAGFDMTINGLSVTLTNTSTLADSYLWDFGDGTTSTEFEPSKTYANPGAYDITLTATNANGDNQTVKLVWMPEDIQLTANDLIGGAWKIRMAPISVFVGESLGNPNWWIVPWEEMQEGQPWGCMMNDEFIFSAGGVYEYKTNEDARNDGFNGQAKGCFSDAELAAISFPFLSAIHTWELNTSGATPYILLTQGETTMAPFIGFYKGYYGGENNESATVPNGGLNTNRYEVYGFANSGDKQYLFLSVDLNGDAEGNSSWSVILERPKAN